jgi:hypothetical protein
MIEKQGSRRRFLSSFLWLAMLGLTRSRVTWAEVTKQTKQDRLRSLLEDLLKHTESAVVIGREYLRQAPGEREPQILVDLISSRCCEGVFGSDSEKLRASLRLHRRHDFAAGHIVKIHGWMLSITEARLCALAARVLDPRSVDR